MLALSRWREPRADMCGWIVAVKLSVFEWRVMEESTWQAKIGFPNESADYRRARQKRYSRLISLVVAWSSTRRI